MQARKERDMDSPVACPASFPGFPRIRDPVCREATTSLYIVVKPSEYPMCFGLTDMSRQDPGATFA